MFFSLKQAGAGREAQPPTAANTNANADEEMTSVTQGAQRGIQASVAVAGGGAAAGPSLDNRTATSSPDKGVIAKIRAWCSKFSLFNNSTNAAQSPVRQPQRSNELVYRGGSEVKRFQIPVNIDPRVHSFVQVAKKYLDELLNNDTAKEKLELLRKDVQKFVNAKQEMQRQGFGYTDEHRRQNIQANHLLLFLDAV